jgi:methionine biosynthesis protein MetW
MSYTTERLILNSAVRNARSRIRKDCLLQSQENLNDHEVKTFCGSAYAKGFAETHSKYIKAIEILKNCRRVLDIGCGDGSFCDLLKETSKHSEAYGIDISDEAVKIALSKGMRAYLLNVGEDAFPFENEFFDGVFCGEVIEHLYDPDHLLDEIYRILSRDGVCILTTPNLASWYNRLFLLLGYQPLFTEVSKKYGVGHPFRWWIGAGHIRVFTLKALTELVMIHKFRIVSKMGFGINTRLGYGKRWIILAKVANKIFSRPSLSSDIFLVLKKQPK